MRQQTLSAQNGFERYGEKTRREQFLEQMDQVVPWAEVEALVRPALSEGRERVSAHGSGHHAADSLSR